MANTWYNDNENISFPIVVRADGVHRINDITIPNSVFVDAGFVIGCSVPSTPSTEVWLSSMTYTSGSPASLTFTFSIGDTGWSYSFTRYSNTVGFAMERVTGTDGVHYDGSGYLVTGDMSGLFAQFSVTRTVTDTNKYTRIEPALVRSLYGGMVTSVIAYNDQKTPCVPCDEWPITVQTVDPAYVATGTGAIKLVPGINCRLAVDDISNSIQVQAVIDKTCNDQSGSSSSSSCSYPFPCNELLYTINGVAPDANGNFTIVAGKGVSVTVSDGTLTITVDPLSACEVC